MTQERKVLLQTLAWHPSDNSSLVDRETSSAAMMQSIEDGGKEELKQGPKDNSSPGSCIQLMLLLALKTIQIYPLVSPLLLGPIREKQTYCCRRRFQESRCWRTSRHWICLLKCNISGAKDNPSILSGLDSTDKEEDIDDHNDFTGMAELEETECVEIQEQDLERQVQVQTPQVASATAMAIVMPHYKTTMMMRKWKTLTLKQTLPPLIMPHLLHPLHAQVSQLPVFLEVLLLCYKI